MSAQKKLFASRQHPNAVIARQELEHQERSRLRRLSEVRPSSSNARSRPGSAGRSRPSSRPATAGGQLSGHQQSSNRAAGEEFESLRGRVSRSPSGSPSKPGMKGLRSCSETATQLRTDFMVSPQRRLEDAANQFMVSSAEQARVLQEELQSWYFSNGATFNIELDPLFGQAGGSASGVWVDLQKPAVDVLQEAAAAIANRPKAAAGGPPPPMPPGRGASGGCRGVAAATANREAGSVAAAGLC